MPYIMAEGAGGPPQPGFFGGWLGRSHDPMFVLKDPNAADFGMPELSLPGRRRTRAAATREEGSKPRSAARLQGGGDRRLGDLDQFQAKAFELLTSSATQSAFRIDREDPDTRDRYGRNIYGQSVLARPAAVEAGTRDGHASPGPPTPTRPGTPTATTSASSRTRSCRSSTPRLSSLLDDLAARGMLDRTLVVVMGEFGRRPRSTPAAGRDHWNFGYSLLLAGGGIKAGHVHGASDKIGGRPHSDPVTPAEIVATIYSVSASPTT